MMGRIEGFAPFFVDLQLRRPPGYDDSHCQSEGDLIRPRCARPPSPPGEGFWEALRRPIYLSYSTFTLQRSYTPLEARTPILALPLPTAVTFPKASTVAMLSSLLAHSSRLSVASLGRTLHCRA